MKITTGTYNQMKELIAEYEKEKLENSDSTIESTQAQDPYFKIYQLEIDYKYNTNYGDNRVCVCGHAYYRHFDSYERMESCKYCQCNDFVEAKPKE